MNLAFKTALVGLCSFFCISMCSANQLPSGDQESANTPGAGFDLWINPGIMSHHFDRNAGYRERNWGYGVQSSLSARMSLMAGNYINSDNARSDYAGVIWQPWSWHAAKIGLAAAAFNGYPLMRHGGWFPAVLPLISIRNERVGVNLTIFPSYAARGLHGAIAAQFILRVW